MPVSSQLSINSPNVPPGGVGSTILQGAGAPNTGHIHNVGGVLGASHLSIQGSPTLTSGLQQGLGLAGSNQLGQNNLHVGAVQHVAAQQLPPGKLFSCLFMNAPVLMHNYCTVVKFYFF